jgi:uncharacterized oxidoreductase
MKLDGNTILITGGASGIGFELAKRLAEKGNTLILTGRDLKKLEHAKSQLPAVHIIKSDVSSVAEIEALVARLAKDFPNLNILINNAGVMRSVNMHDKGGSLEDLTQEIDINFKGPVRMAKALLPQLKKMPSAAIVNISSGLAFVPLPISPVYCATKAAIHSFTLSLRVQLTKTNVKVFELAPPATQTDLLGNFEQNDMKGVSIMKVEDMVQACLKGMADDRYEIRPGQSNQLKFMSRLAPDFILAQLSKPAARMMES